MTTLPMDHLTKPMQRALIDMVARGGLSRNESGWDGTCLHRHTTMKALEDRGLCRFENAGDMGEVYPTALGRKMVGDECAAMNAMIRDSESRR